jgi:hypothetical protein
MKGEESMITIKRVKDSTTEKIVAIVDKREVMAVERTVFQPSWKVLQFSQWPENIAGAREYTKCMNDLILAAEYSR